MMLSLLSQSLTCLIFPTLLPFLGAVSWCFLLVGTYACPPQLSIEDCCLLTGVTSSLHPSWAGTLSVKAQEKAKDTVENRFEFSLK